MDKTNRPAAFWIILVFLALSVVLLVLGQTLALFHYDLTVRLGLQESAAQVGEFGVQVNRAFGAGDTIVYIPLMIASVVGLYRKKRWALLTTAAVAGISVYWTVTVAFMMAFLQGVAGYRYTPGVEIWLFVGAYMFFGVWCLFYLLSQGEALLDQSRGRV